MEADGEVIQRSLEEPAVFAEIFHRHFDRVEAYARRRVGSTAGEEVAAQTFLVAFERRGRFDTRYLSARPWLLGIATNLIRHHVRDERVHLAAVARAPIDPPSAAIDDLDHVDAERLRPQLAEALRTFRSTTARRSCSWLSGSSPTSRSRSLSGSRSGPCALASTAPAWRSTNA